MSDATGLRSGAILGEEAKPSFAVLPDPSTLFLKRARRFATLAPAHQLGPYLSFLAILTGAQHEVQTGLPTPGLPPAAGMEQAREHGMPPLLRTLYEPDVASLVTLEALLARLSTAELPEQTAVAVERLSTAPREERRQALASALKEVPEENDLPRRVLVLAGLQVQFAQMAAQLDAKSLKPIAHGACPACGSAPVSSAVVGWPKAFNTRFCTCSLCATMWNVTRVTCLMCSSTDGVNYRSIENNPDTVKAETCDKCQSYVKVMYQVKDPTLEPLADDVATLGLDILLAEEGWKRGAQNPFLLGY